MFCPFKWQWAASSSKGNGHPVCDKTIFFSNGSENDMLWASAIWLWMGIGRPKMARHLLFLLLNWLCQPSTKVVLISQVFQRPPVVLLMLPSFCGKSSMIDLDIFFWIVTVFLTSSYYLSIFTHEIYFLCVPSEARFPSSKMNKMENARFGKLLFMSRQQKGATWKWRMV